MMHKKLCLFFKNVKYRCTCLGSCEQSYGINVARSVDFPAHVVEAAVKNAEKLENFVDKNKYESSVVEVSLNIFQPI